MTTIDYIELNCIALHYLLVDITFWFALLFGWHYFLVGITRGQTNTDNPAEYGYIRNRIVPLGMKRISI